MATEAVKQLQLPRIDFSGVDPSAPGAGQWAAVRAQVVDALATFGCFDAHYPALGPDLRAALFDGAVRELFALPADTKRCNTYGPDKPLYGYLAGIPCLANAFESLAIADRVEPERVQAFADLMWPDGGNPAFCETVHGAAKRIAALEEAVRWMVMEGLGVAKYHDALSESTRHVFRMSRYKAPGDGDDDAEGKQKQVRYGTHQDCNTLTVVCQHQVDGLEVQARGGDWILARPSSPASLVGMAGNALRDGHGQTTACTRRFTGSPSVGMPTGTPPSCSRSPTTRSRRQMSSSTRSTSPFQAPLHRRVHPLLCCSGCSPRRQTRGFLWSISTAMYQ